MDDFDAARRHLLAEIEAETRETAAWTGRDRLSPEVMAAMGRVPRHLFVPEEERPLAYRNHPLAIGAGQTISQPYMVAVMTDLLNLSPRARVLEIGTGSGYQTAILAEVAGEVYSIECVPELAEGAARVLDDLGYRNLHLRVGQGRLGWPEAAPFDAVIVTAAARALPPALAEQLAPNGRMIIPIDGRVYPQRLMLFAKDANGRLSERMVLPVAFVPLIGEGVGG